MTGQSTTASAPPNVLRSTGAILVGFFAVLVLSLGTDQIFHVLKIYPPWSQPMWDPGLNFLALSYRIVCAILGSYIAARFAPRNPMHHAMVLGYVGLVLSIIGAIGATRMNLGPLWYPVALVFTTLPCAWMGGRLYRQSPIPS